jgi:hypothetical protein
MDELINRECGTKQRKKLEVVLSPIGSFDGTTDAVEIVSQFSNVFRNIIYEL